LRQINSALAFSRHKKYAGGLIFRPADNFSSFSRDTLAARLPPSRAVFLDWEAGCARLQPWLSGLFFSELPPRPPKAPGFGSVCFSGRPPVFDCPVTLNRTQPMLPSPLTTRFDLRAEPSPGLLPRLLQPFAKRDVTPDLFQARRAGEEMDITITCFDLESGMAALIAGNLGQVIGVSRVVVTPGESLATRRA
jgi:hypothetical protein